ncbi:hypothetical protein [Edaphocola aurantiacus]|uniref:hypothetical protein n=1 Tax=Edaphocola aurantiacus TaxID=2601682 RepID=UPI001C97565E|nr:hypothetical protein [Edaphocola aurantiacus]
MNITTKFIALCAIAVAGVNGVSAQQTAKVKPATSVSAQELSELKNPLVLINDLKTDYETFNRYKDILQGVRIVKGAEAVKLYGQEAAGGVILVQPAPGNRFMNFETLEAGNDAIRTTVRDGVTVDGQAKDTKRIVLRQSDIKGIGTVSVIDPVTGKELRYLNITTK